jgi:rhodanese-related sulfurtransferase
MVVVNCAGRTRSIVGAQTLIDMGVPNRVVALRNGTMGWRLAGFDLDQSSGLTHPLETPPAALESAQRSAAALAAADGIQTVTGNEVDAWLDCGTRSVFLLDVRTESEFSAAHQPGAVHAPGGQLVQATDQWVAVRGAILVLIDDEQVRAPLVGRWLQRMGHEVVVLAAGHVLRERDAAVVESQLPELARLDVAELPTDAALIDLRSSAAFDAGHLRGANWSIRPRLANLKPGTSVVLIADTAQVAALASLDLAEIGTAVVGWLPGDLMAWRDAGLEVVTESRLANAERIDYLFFVHDRHDGNMEAARTYLEWETGLAAQLDSDERALFAL